MTFSFPSLETYCLVLSPVFEMNVNEVGLSPSVGHDFGGMLEGR